MAEESWHRARLIPTSGISGAEEQERRATSALLAVLPAVREFGRSILTPLGAPAGTIETFIEVPFQLGDRRLYPDGLIRVSRGQRSWTALVEVKTGSNQLDAEQLESYLEIARENGFNALITISNEIPAMAGTHPTAIDKRKLKKVALHHFPWTQILTEAVVQKVHRGVADPDQAWILGELIRYLEHARSGALEFEDMGGSWTGVRDAVVAGTLRANDKGAAEVASRWDQLMRYACLRLGKQLGVEVQPVLSRKELADPTVRAQALLDSLASRGALDGSLRIPNAVGPITLTADLRAGRVSAAVDIDAPREGKQQTRVNWLVRQLKTAPESLRMDCFTLHARGASTSELLKVVRDSPAALVQDPKREIRTFSLVLSAPMGTKRGQGRGSFVTSVLDLLNTFYEEVVQAIKPWSAAPPRLRPTTPGEPEPVVPALVSTSLSSQDGAETNGPPVPASDNNPAAATREGNDELPAPADAETEPP
ncbi:MAG: FIG00817171: hypothetical protein [uncultured Acidimicrobiales bacterium]|uniref:Stress response protein n=1 Tax=uncultured Acidimicrobiales bacterium TaxID=310071 RepID=A0A6J4H622_9ACTN|nr:MAG: FIG00817171: hypothetical protein [uncultured Acidimicrobiales bacterium]